MKKLKNRIKLFIYFSKILFKKVICKRYIQNRQCKQIKVYFAQHLASLKGASLVVKYLQLHQEHKVAHKSLLL